MSQVQLELDDEILARAERLALERGMTIEQLFAKLVEQASRPVDSAPDQVLGLFRDEPDLMDQVTEDALRAREEQPLRTSNG